MNFLCCHAAVLLLYTIARSQAIDNIDILEPIIRRSPARSVSADDGFGWAVVFHQIEDVFPNDTIAESIRKTRLIVGAPRGTYPGGLSLTDPAKPHENRTGLVYSCPSAGSDMCEGVRGNTTIYIGPDINANITNGVQLDLISFSQAFNPDITEGRLFDQAPNTLINNIDVIEPFEEKRNQLLGSFLHSTQDYILACAPLWVTTDFNVLNDAAQPRGICYVGDRQLRNFQTLLPCILSGDNGATENDGYCITGYGATIAGDKVFVGTPGRNEFTGSVFSRSIIGSQTPFSPPVDPPVPSGSFEQTFGHSMAAGYVTNNNRSEPPPNVVITSPRHNGTSYTGMVFFYNHNLTRLLASITIMGTQLGEFFGYSMALCDLTGDGYDELIVGAPIYTTYTPKLVPDRGRIYIYFNTGGSLNDTNPLIIEGQVEGDRYGSSIANAGDLDNDGKEDLIVGAPYKINPNSSDTGAVYIYYGRGTPEEFMRNPPVRIFASDITDRLTGSFRLRTFGFSLIGNTDIDNNNHPDVAIGAYQDQTVVVLRTLPIITVGVTMDPVPPVDLRTVRSFDVVVRANYTSASISDARDVPFTLTEKVMTGRVFFSQNNQSDRIGNGVLSFSRAGNQAMANITVYTIRSVSSVAPYEFVVSVPNTDRSAGRVSGEQDPTDLSGFPRFRLIGNPNLAVEIQDPCSIDMQAGCISDVALLPPDSNTRSLVAGVSPINIELEYTNNGPEDARGLVLVINGLSNDFFTGFTLTYNNMNQGEGQYDCNTIQQAGSAGNASCMLESTLIRGQRRSANLTLFTATTFAGNEPPFDLTFEIVVTARSPNIESNTNNNIQTLRLNPDSMSNIKVSLDFTRGDTTYSAMAPALPLDYIQQLGELVPLRVVVQNDGPSTILNSKVEIRYPNRPAGENSQFYYLYPSFINREIGPGANINCTMNGINPDRLIPQSMQGRRRRSVMDVVDRRARRKADMEIIRTRRQAVNRILNCSSTSDACLKFTCDIQKLTSASAATISIDSYVDNRFFAPLEDSSEYILVAAATVTVGDQFQRDDDNLADNSNLTTVTLRPPMAPTPPGDIIHAIIWPSIGGVLILVILVVILYFVGFFRRKKKPGEDGDEIDGDFNPPKPEGKPEETKEAKEGEIVTKI